MAAVPAADERKRLADISPESHAAWRAFADRHVNPDGRADGLTALVESVGLYLEQYTDRALLPVWLERVVADALELHHERRRRPGQRRRRL